PFRRPEARRAQGPEERGQGSGQAQERAPGDFQAPGPEGTAGGRSLRGTPPLYREPRARPRTPPGLTQRFLWFYAASGKIFRGPLPFWVPVASKLQIRACARPFGER